MLYSIIAGAAVLIAIVAFRLIFKASNGEWVIEERLEAFGNIFKKKNLGKEQNKKNKQNKQKVIKPPKGYVSLYDQKSVK